MQAPLFKTTLVTVSSLVLAILVLAIPGQARITRLVVEHTEMPGHDGYQKLTGHAYGELDPKLPLNAIITDLEFAPRNARGMVEYCGDIHHHQTGRHGESQRCAALLRPEPRPHQFDWRWIPRRCPKAGPRAGRQRLARRPRAGRWHRDAVGAGSQKP